MDESTSSISSEWSRITLMGQSWRFCVVCISCLVHSLRDPDLDIARKFLGDRGKKAYEIVLDSIGGPSYLENCKHDLIPIGEPDVLSESNFYIDLFENEKKLRLQKELQNLANVVAHQKFVEYLDHSNVNEKIVME